MAGFLLYTILYCGALTAWDLAAEEWPWMTFWVAGKRYLMMALLLSLITAPFYWEIFFGRHQRRRVSRRLVVTRIALAGLFGTLVWILAFLGWPSLLCALAAVQSPMAAVLHTPSWLEYGDPWAGTLAVLVFMLVLDRVELPPKVLADREGGSALPEKCC